jgi:hypothetical protein
MDLRDGALVQCPLVQSANSRPYTAQVVPTGSQEENEPSSSLWRNLSDLHWRCRQAAEHWKSEPKTEFAFVASTARFPGGSDAQEQHGHRRGVRVVCSILTGEVTLLGGRHPSVTAHLRVEAFIDLRLLSPKEDDPGLSTRVQGGSSITSSISMISTKTAAFRRILPTPLFYALRRQIRTATVTRV